MKKTIIKILVVLLSIIIIVSAVVILNGYKLYQTTIEAMSLKDKIAYIKSDSNYVSYSDVPDYSVAASSSAAPPAIAAGPPSR